MHTKVRTTTKGQAMPIFALLLGLGVLIGLLAIAFDGGSALLQRRTQQNAADAGVQAGIEMLGRSMLASCVPTPCHTVFMVENNRVIDRVNELASSNRGGTTGPGTYTVTVEYHYMSGAPTYSGTYQLAPYNTAVVPPFVDGLRVTATIRNPTTFARAMPGPSGDVTVSARAAARLFATCPPDPGPQDAPLPFTRFRPSLQLEIYTKGNDPCNPYTFWDSSNDVWGAGQTNAFKNVLSFNENTIYPENPEVPPTQLLTETDQRYGPAVDVFTGHCTATGNRYWPECGLIDFAHATNWSKGPPYCGTEPCADMRGSSAAGGTDAQQDIANWIYYSWNGTISLDSTWPSVPGRVGDWAEGYEGNYGNNIHDAVHDLARDFGSPAYFTPLGWGNAVTRTVYMWGEPLTDTQVQNQNPSGYSASTATQYLRNMGCSPQPCTPTYQWTDSTVEWANAGGGRFQLQNGSQERIHRVRFTDRRVFVFYQALNGNSNVTGPGGCTIQVNASAAMGFFPSTYVPGPSTESCPIGWTPGTGVYSRVVDPNAP